MYVSSGCLSGLQLCADHQWLPCCCAGSAGTRSARNQSCLRLGAEENGIPAVKKEKKVFDMPGQTKDTPLEVCPHRDCLCRSVDLHPSQRDIPAAEGVRKLTWRQAPRIRIC